jgi:hypothetical protein
MLAAVGSKFKGLAQSRRTLFLPCRYHADNFILHGIFSGVKIVPIFIGLLARRSG